MEGWKRWEWWKGKRDGGGKLDFGIANCGFIHMTVDWLVARGVANHWKIGKSS